MKRDRKDILIGSLKESLGLFGLSDSNSDYIAEKIPYEKLRYYNLNFTAAAFFADGDESKFKETLEILDQENTTGARIALVSYTERLVETQKIVLPYDIFIYLRRIIPQNVFDIICDAKTERKLSFETVLTVEEYLTHGIELPVENSFMKSTNNQRLFQLVNLGFYIPNLRSDKIYLNEKKKSLVFSGIPRQINPEIPRKHFVNYMKWAIAVASNWTYFSDIFEELSESESLIEGVLQVANLETTLKDLRLERISIEDISFLFHKAEKPIQFKEIEYNSIKGSSKMYSIIDSEPVRLSKSNHPGKFLTGSEAVLNCIKIANDYSPIVGIAEFHSGEIKTENEIQFLFFDSSDEIKVYLEDIYVLIPINKALVIVGEVSVRTDHDFLVVF